MVRPTQDQKVESEDLRLGSFTTGHANSGDAGRDRHLRHGSIADNDPFFAETRSRRTSTIATPAGRQFYFEGLDLSISFRLSGRAARFTLELRVPPLSN
jgi:hypothetical protein